MKREVVFSMGGAEFLENGILVHHLEPKKLEDYGGKNCTLLLLLMREWIFYGAFLE
jgi:hypothetical protein